MSKRTRHRYWTAGNGSFFLCLSLLAVFFLAGVVFGQVSAVRNEDTISAELYQYLTGYCTLESGDGSVGRIFLSALLIYFRYPMLAFLLSFAIPGALLLPIISAAFGFFLSYATCCFVEAFHEPGVLLAAAVFGLRCLISLPCFFVLAVPATQRAITRLYERFFLHGKRMQTKGLGLEWWLLVCIVVAVLLGGALAEVLFAPVLMKCVFESCFLL